MDISVIGISAEAEELYRYFLRHRGEGIGSVRQALNLDPDTIEAAAEVLGRLDPHDPGRRARRRAVLLRAPLDGRVITAE